jgi:RNA polymerase sigma factor (sigma-70 family)
VCPTSEQGKRSRLGADAPGARKRAAIETYSRHEAALRRTARRYSLCADDADDALQRGLEILLRKAPTDDPRELIRWTQTVVKHEALAVRRERERILGRPSGAGDPESGDWVALLPSEADGPVERAERRETVARSREALQALKPPELRALALLAEGYSYAEIGEMTGWSKTKVNRSLAEGRERFRSLISRSEDGTRCVELRPAISAFCDGEAVAEEARLLREHLRVCPHCRATVRAYRAAPAAAAALAPILPAGRSFLDRLHEALTGFTARFSGGGGSEAAVSQVAVAGGSRGAGAAALAKALALCLGTAGGAAACAASGVIPVPFAADHDRPQAAKPERQASATAAPETPAPAVAYEPEPPQPSVEDPDRSVPAATEQPEPPTASSGAVEYAPPPPAPAAPPASPAGDASGDAAGEFGP